MRFSRAAALILSLGPLPATADQPPLASVGEITYGTAAKPGAANCTGTLVAADLVLTARHCLPENTLIRFAAGRNQTAAPATSSGQIEPLALSALSDDPTTALAQDLGLLRLDTPLPASLVLPLSSAVKPSTQFTLIAYRRDAPHAASVNTFCRLVQITPPILGLTCPVVSGNSGAPLLVQQDGVWHLAAVMVAQNHAPGALRSFAVMPSLEILAKISGP